MRPPPQAADAGHAVRDATVYEDPDHIFKALSSGASGYF